MTRMNLGDAQLLTIVYATPDGPRVTDIAIADHALDPDDPRRPGDIICRDAEFDTIAWARALEAAAAALRGAQQ